MESIRMEEVESCSGNWAPFVLVTMEGWRAYN
jgi:hypothetical protein